MKLVCPHCGGDLFVNLMWVGSTYAQSQEVDVIECYGDWRECGAEWDANFEPKTPSKKEKTA